MLTQAIGDVLAPAVGVALSPIPIIAVILMLGTPRARSNGPAFAVGWVAGMVLVATVVLVVLGGDASDPESGASQSVDWFQVGIGLLFFGMARRQWSKRPQPGVEQELPAWMSAIDAFTPRRSLVLGLALSAANPKNLVLTMAAAASIAQAGLSGGEDAIAVAAFVAVASITVVGSVAFYLVATERAQAPLDSMRTFMLEHNAVIMMVILVILGAKFIGEGIGAVSA